MIGQAVKKIRDFIGRQKHNYRVGMARSAGSSFLTRLTGQYAAIYTVGLGADPVQLGSLSSVSSAISALISTPIGWLMDHHGIRGLYLLGIALMAGSSLLYALAHDWRLLFGAALFASIAMRLNGTGCRVICTDSVQSRDRVTAQNVCGTLASMVGMIAPLVAAHLVTLFGGMTVEGIRPLYYLQLGGYGILFLIVAHQLREPQAERLAGASDRHGFLDDFRLLFTGRRDLGRWIAISALTSLPMAVF